MISIRPTQNVGSEKPRIEPAMIVRPATPLGFRPAHRPSGMPSTTAISIAAIASSIVAGMRSRMRPSADVACTNERPRSPVQRALEEHEVLLPQRLVEAERRDRALAVDLVGLRVDQDVDRVADRVDADEHEQRHHEEHDDALHAAADDVDEHRSRSRTRRDGSDAVARCIVGEAAARAPCSADRALVPLAGDGHVRLR